MAGVLQHLRSSTLNKRPNPASMVDGQVAINYASGSPGMFFKDSNGSLVKVGPVHVGSTAPNVSPASGGTAGNSLGEQWLDTSGGTYVFKIWDGGSWRSEAGEFVNSTGDTMTGSLTMGPAATLIFEGSADDGFETTLTVVNPTVDRTITLPNVTGTVITTGDTGTVTSTMLLDGTILDADVNASAAIAGTKISPNFGSQTITTTGIVSAALGAAATPSITFTGDTNTGIYSPGADQVAISTGGSGRLFVDASGRVYAPNSTAIGPGTSTPTRTLQLSDTTGQPAIKLTNDTSGHLTTDGADLTFTGTNLFITNREAGAIVAEVNGSERLRITSAGLVGIGTSSPSERLHIAGTGQKILVAPIDFNSNQNSAYLIAGTTSYTGATTNWGTYGLQHRFKSDAGGIPRVTVDANTGELFCITGEGKVGIGTTSPGLPLQVVGTIGTTPASTNSGFLLLSGNSGAAAGCTIESSFTSGGYGPLLFKVNNGEAARIDSSGRLLVGTSTSAGSGSAVQIRQDGGNNLELFRSADSANPARIYISKSRGSAASPTAVSAEDMLSEILVNGHDGTSFVQASSIRTFVDGTPGTNDMPGRLVFSTTADGASSPTERMRIANAGMVGINKTPAGGILLDVEGPIRSTNGTIDLRLQAGAGGAAGVGSFSSDALLLITAGNERARVDTSGRLLVGTSSASQWNHYSSDLPLQVARANSLNTAIQLTSFRANDEYGSNVILGKSRSNTLGTNTAISDGDFLGELVFTGANGTSWSQGAGISARADGQTWANGDCPTRLVFSTTADGASSPTEAMRITNSRRVYIGTTTGVINTANFGTAFFNDGYFNAAGNFNGTQELARWYGNAGSVRFMGDGDVENTNNSYGALSDIKLKENVVTAGSQWDDIKALQVRKYNLKAETGYSTHTQIGLVAQEVELVSPGLVGESADRDSDGNDLGTVTKSVNYSVLYMKAVKALQEAMERIELLEARLDAANL